MTKFRISPRLKAVADLVESSSFVDIGADHGYLDLYLIQKGHKGPIAVTENKRGPFERLRKNMKIVPPSTNVECVFADGLDFDYQKYSQVVISGMGGSLIARILKSAKYGLNNFETLILEPQSDAYTVRKTIGELGFKIVFEKYITERSKTYSIIKCIKGCEPCNEVELIFGKYPLENKDVILREYLQKNEKRISGLLKDKKIDADAKKTLETQLNMIEKGLNYYGR